MRKKRVLSLADRLAVARREDLIGRDAELDLFRAALQVKELPFALLFIHGPGGIGKTTLLREYTRLAQETDLLVVALDGRNLAPLPNAVLLALRETLGIAENVSPFDAFASFPRSVLLIDNFEALSPLEFWFTDTFLPRLPEECFVVLAGRTLPSAEWCSAPGWRDLIRTVSLRNLSPEQTRHYLRARGVPEPQHQTALDFTHGHPLALSLVADAVAQGDSPTTFTLENQPDVVRTLLEHFVRNVPSPRHRFALEACAHVRVTTEDLLARALEVNDTHEFFDWLRGLSFVEQGTQGLFPHDLVRDVVDADLRWRNRASYRALHQRVRDHIVQRMQERQGVEQQRAFLDLLHLHRNNPLMKPYYDWEAMGNLYAEPASAQDHGIILEMVRRHEGEASARIAAYWLNRQPQAFLAIRGVEPMAVGFAALVSLDEPHSKDIATDPAIKAAWDFVERHAPLRPGEHILYARFFMGREAYQDTSPVFNVIAATTASRWLTMPKLAWAFVALADPEYWQGMYNYINFAHSPEADFQVGSRHMAVFAHDWRAEPPVAWLDVMIERELATDLKPEALAYQAPPQVLVLSQSEFQEAVRRALRDYSDPNALAANPLLRSRLVLERATGRSTIETLQSLIHEAAEQLRGKPKDVKFYRALSATYLKPALTQELAAERLGVPFGTYRYQLAVAIERVTAWLWERELSGNGES